MYKIILVEDEPAAAEHIRDILRIYCPQFELAAAGDNGKTGLELARQYHPDILLTDIRMPVMDGLELIRTLHEELPDIKTIILSGYQDFEYARTALRHGTVDYLLKPISPATLRASLDRVVPLIENEQRQNRLSLLRQLLGEDAPPPDKLNAYFPAPLYTAALMRINGLPSRFSPLIGGIMDRAGEDWFTLTGRDEMEYLHIATGELPNDHFTDVFKHQEIPGYTTTLIWGQPFPLTELPMVVRSLYKALDQGLIIGMTQLIVAHLTNQRLIPKSPPADWEFKDSLRLFLRENKPDRIKKLLEDLLNQYRREEQSQLALEQVVRSFLGDIKYELKSPVSPEEIELMINDAFAYATCYGDLSASLMDVLDKILPNQTIAKVDTPEFFTLIKKYLSAHLAESLSLQSLSGHFGISQTYISRLFRKYTGQSFINYLTIIRIEKAKEYMTDRELLIRDIAALVGYSDQFYFSRVFRTITGRSPSEWVGE
ncbi:response regulator transcription factor [Treponema primitia]|uniref:response regulator transcription factor n=1 Tax=Treponema primitia TaxID=88058 RepID=UPI0002554EBC|nr:response regulator [Treponema primitia]